MLELPQIDTIAADVMRTYLPPGAPARARSHLHWGIDSDDELQVTFVMEDRSFEHFMQGDILALLVSLQDRLRAAGEDRFATIHFASEEELAADGGA